MPDEQTNPNELFWARCQVWGTGRLYRSNAIIIPMGLARRFNIKSGDQLVFKEDLNKHRIIIEITEKPKEGKK